MTVTPKIPWKFTFCPVRNRLGTGVRGGKKVVITEADLHMLSPGDGFKWCQLNEVVGKQLTQDIAANEVIYPQHLSL